MSGQYTNVATTKFWGGVHQVGIYTQLMGFVHGRVITACFTEKEHIALSIVQASL